MPNKLTIEPTEATGQAILGNTGRQDRGKTAFSLGHSLPQMVYKTYASAVREHEVRVFWKI